MAARAAPDPRWVAGSDATDTEQAGATQAKQGIHTAQNAHMIGRTVCSCCYFGTAIRFLGDARPGDSIADDVDGSRCIRTNLRVGFERIAGLDFRVSLQTEAARESQEPRNWGVSQDVSHLPAK